MARNLSAIASRMKRQDAVYAIVSDANPKIKCFALTKAAYILIAQSNSEVANGRLYKKAARLTKRRLVYTLPDKDVRDVSKKIENDQSVTLLPRQGRDALVLVSPQDLDMASFNAVINAKGTQRNLYKPARQFRRRNLSAAEAISMFKLEKRQPAKRVRGRRVK